MAWSEICSQFVVRSLFRSVGFLVNSIWCSLNIWNRRTIIFLFSFHIFHFVCLYISANFSHFSALYICIDEHSSVRGTKRIFKLRNEISRFYLFLRSFWMLVKRQETALFLIYVSAAFLLLAVLNHIFIPFVFSLRKQFSFGGFSQLYLFFFLFIFNGFCCCNPNTNSAFHFDTVII